MRLAHFEGASGIAGDMTVAALLHAGSLDIDDLRGALASLPLTGYGVRTEAVSTEVGPALRFHVDIDHAAHTHHRHWSDIRAMLARGHANGLPAGTFERAMAIFEALARAEAEVHEVAVDDVHFHEVGAVDSIVDIVAAAWCLDRLGIERCTVGTLPTGSGFVDTEHGRLPVPAPATARLLRGFEVRAGDGEGELVTPTGAAILAALAKPFVPALLLEATGSGAGTRRLRDRANVLRVFVGQMEEASDENLVLLETDLDDMTPAALSVACERLRGDGARDVSVLAVQMKKGRLGMRLTVLADPAAVERLAAAVLLHTTSLGVRYRAVRREILARRFEVADTPHGAIRVKVGRRPDGTETAEPEFEDVARAAAESGRPFADVRAAALAALSFKG